MKRAVSLVLAVVLLVTMFGNVSAAKDDVPTFRVDGRLFVTPAGEPQQYINKENRYMASLRLIANVVGVEGKDIKWDNTKQIATLTRGSNTVSVTVGKKEITVNGLSVTMDTSAEMKQGRVFIPVRSVAEGLGLKVSYNKHTNTVNFMTGTEKVSNNFDDIGYKQIEQLPVTVSANGLQVTLEEAYLFKTDSAEAKALHDRYGFQNYKSANHVLWLTVTIANRSKNTISFENSDLEKKIAVTHAPSRSLSLAQATNNLFGNGGDYLNSWSLSSNASITGNIALLDSDNSRIKFLTIDISNEGVTNTMKLAEKID